MNIVTVSLERQSYAILIGRRPHLSDLFAWLGPVVQGRSCLVVSDTNVAPLFLEEAKKHLELVESGPVSTAIMPAGEQHKTIRTLEGLYHDAVVAGLDRKSVIVALGGGVVGDTAGFLAATWQRGVRFVQVPTTLLAMVDSSVGGKVAVDLPEGKNLVGAFHQPDCVVTDLATLDTLPDREWKCGFAEIVKYGVIMDEPFFARLEKDADALLAHDPTVLEAVISRCCELKAQVVGQDEKESGLREILNYGHTFGHALETLGGYAALSHGEAVAIGMRMAARLALLLGRIDAAMEQRQETLLQRLGLGNPPAEIRALDPQTVLDAMRLDKKSRAGKLRLVLPSRLGHCETVQGIDETLVRQAITAILK